MPKAIIEIQGLSKQYRGSDVFSVSDLSLTIGQGEIFGLLGPNGAGKTTLISMLCGLVKPTAGHFTIKGMSYHSDATKIKHVIGVVPQEYALYPTLTAVENLQYFGAMYGLKGAHLKLQIEESLELLGLSRFANKRIDTYSGGMKRRVNLIAGLLHNPEILFLDEPTVGVDVQSRHVILDFLKARNTSGTTIVYTSHHLREAEDFCTDIAIIDNGRIYAQGSAPELVAASLLSNNLEDVFIALTGKELRDA